MSKVALRTSDYERIFRVLECCDEATSVPDFAGRLLSALASQFGLRHTTFFTGPTFHAAFNDPAPLLSGRTPKMFPEYHASWADRDAFASGQARQALRATRVASLNELPRRSDDVADYLDDFLFKYGMRSASGIWLRLPTGRHALVGLFDPDPSAVGERELTALRLLARQLNVISRALPVEGPRPGDELLARLPHRQRQVAALVAQGLTNAAIGRRLSLSEDTVKKYVSRLLAASGCRSRTELALLVRSPQ